MDFLCELIHSFLDGAPSAVLAISDAIARSDASALAFSAHSLKGTVSQFYCPPVREAALALEMMGKRADLHDAPAALGRLKKLLDGLYSELRDIQRTRRI